MRNNRVEAVGFWVFVVLSVLMVKTDGENRPAPRPALPSAPQAVLTDRSYLLLTLERFQPRVG